jgi:hypothetical protein
MTEEDAKKVVQAITDVWNAITETVENVIKCVQEFFSKREKKPPRASWHVPKKLNMQSQVLSRKPLMAVARSCC